VKSILRIKTLVFWCVRGSECPHVWVELIEMHWRIRDHVEVLQFWGHCAVFLKPFHYSLWTTSVSVGLQTKKVPLWIFIVSADVQYVQPSKYIHLALWRISYLGTYFPHIKCQDITSEFHAVTMFVILNAQRIAHVMRKYAYDPPPGHTPNCRGS